MGERNIPHLRDIFGVPFDGIDRSPRSRRYRESYQPPSPPPPTTRHNKSFEQNADPDSAVSVGSSGEEENYHSHKKKGSKNRSRIDDYGTRTLTQKDVRHLERHLSMKKTIRKKIMRDLRQAFVEDPNEFRVDPGHSSLTPEQLREINLQNLRLNGDMDSNFLEILRTDGNNVNKHNNTVDDDQDSGHGSPTREMNRRREIEENNEKQSSKSSGGFWKRFTLKSRSSKR